MNKLPDKQIYINKRIEMKLDRELEVLKIFKLKIKMYFFSNPN